MPIIIFIVYSLITVAYTYPLALHLKDYIFSYSGDNFGLVWGLWWQNYALKHGMDVTHPPFFNAPVGGIITSLSGETGWALPMRYLAGLIGEIPTFNLFIILSFPLSAMAMYLLVSYLFKNKWAAFLAGLTYMLAPFHFWQSYSHMSLSQIQWLPLFVLALFYFDRERGWKSALFLSLSFLLVFLFSFYLGFFSAIVGVFFFIFKLIFSFKSYLNIKTLKLSLVAFVIIVLGVLPTIKMFQTARVEGSSGSEVFNRQMVELLGLSARPWDFLIYPPNHPYLGRYNKPIYDFIQSLSSDFKFRSTYLPERIVFLGVLNFLLAGLGLLIFFRRNSTVRFLLLLAFFSLVVSLPPYFNIKGITFYTPSYFIFLVFPLVRVYSRFGIYVFIFTVLISAFTVKSLAEKVRSKVVWFLLYSALTLVTLFEFLPGLGYTDLSKMPQVYQWLKSQPGDFIILEYPKGFDIQTALLFQRYHGKRILNMMGSDPRYKLWDDMRFLSNPAAYATLKREGVKYVIYHLTDLTYNPYDDWRFFRFALLPGIDEEKFFSDIGLKKVASFPEALVYEVK